LLPQWRDASQAFDRLCLMLARQSMPLQPASMGMTVIITSIMQVNFVMRWGNFGITLLRRLGNEFYNMPCFAASYVENNAHGKQQKCTQAYDRAVTGR
jgi:hypothetical protein